jgi:hypothetical protein
MPKPKFQRADAFEQTKPTPSVPASGTVPYINAGEMNSAVYENGASSFPMSGFEDPVEKENEALREKIAATEEEKDLWRQQAEELRYQLEAQSSGIVIQDGGLAVQGFQFSPTGLIAPDAAQITREAWNQVGKLLFRLEGSIQWLIGDWVVYGEGRYGDIKKIAEIFGRKPETLYNYASVSRSIETSRRREVLSFGHHYEVIGLEPDEQDEALTYAVEHNLSVAAFRKLLRGDGSKPSPTLSGGLDTDKSYNAMKKLMQRDPVTLKPQERETARLRLLELRRWIDEMERRLIEQDNA